MNIYDIFHGTARINAKSCEAVEQCRSIHCWYYNHDSSRSYDETYTKDDATGLWDVLTEVYDETAPVSSNNADDWDPNDAQDEPLRTRYQKPSLNTETVIEYVRDNLRYNDCPGVEYFVK